MLWQPTWWMINDDQCLKYFASLTRCAKHFWSALLKDRARDMFLPCRFCKKTEIAQIRLPWGRHDFSLHVWFLRYQSVSMIFSWEGSRTYRRKGAQSPPDPPMKEHHWAVAVWMELVFPQTCYWLCADASKTVARRRQNIWPGNLFKVEAAKLLQNSDQSISITRTTHTSLSGHVVRYGNT